MASIIEDVRFIGHRTKMIQYTGRNTRDVTGFLGTGSWIEVEGRIALPDDWLYIGRDGKPVIISNRLKRLDTETIERPATGSPPAR